MVFVIIMICLFLMGSVMTNVYLYQELLDARHRAYCAEEWMDPIDVEGMNDGMD